MYCHTRSNWQTFSWKTGVGYIIGLYPTPPHPVYMFENTYILLKQLHMTDLTDLNLRITRVWLCSAQLVIFYLLVVSSFVINCNDPSCLMVFFWSWLCIYELSQLDYFLFIWNNSRQKNSVQAQNYQRKSAHIAVLNDQYKYFLFLNVFCFSVMYC